MNIIKVVVETPKGSSQKYNYDPATGFFFFKKSLAEGMCFPFDFGFIPGTKGQDGDPLDAIVISEFRMFPGCLLECRVIGNIQAQQTEKGSEEKIRNDRFIAVPVNSTVYNSITKIKQLPQKLLGQLESFFINYNKEENKIFKIVQLSGPATSMKLIVQNKMQ